MKTHYFQEGKIICGARLPAKCVKTKTNWYSTINKCKKCGDIIKSITIIS